MPGSTEKRLGSQGAEATLRSRAERRATGAHGCGYSGTAKVCVEESGGVSEEGILGLSDAWVLRKRALECRNLEATFPLNILISGGSGTEPRLGKEEDWDGD